MHRCRGKKTKIFFVTKRTKRKESIKSRVYRERRDKGKWKLMKAEYWTKDIEVGKNSKPGGLLWLLIGCSIILIKDFVLSELEFK